MTHDRHDVMSALGAVCATLYIALAVWLVWYTVDSMIRWW